MTKPKGQTISRVDEAREAAGYFATLAGNARDKADAVKLTDADSFVSVAEDLSFWKHAANDLAAKQKSLLAPLAAETAGVKNEFAPVLGDFAKAEATTKEKLVTWCLRFEEPSTPYVTVTWLLDFTVVDPSKVPDEFKVVDASLVRAALKSGKVVPGVELNGIERGDGTRMPNIRVNA